MKKVSKRLIAFIFTLIFLILIFYKIDIKETIEAFKSFNCSNLLSILSIYFLGFIIRIYRWSELLDDCKNCKKLDLLGMIFTGNMLNCYLPARAGDFYRAYYIGKNYSIKKIKAFTTIFLERVFDGSVVFFFLLISIISVYHKAWVINLAMVVGLMFLGIMLTLFLMAKYANVDSLCQKISHYRNKLPNIFQNRAQKFIEFLNKHLKSFMEGIERLQSSGTIIKTFLFTSGIWICECLAYMFVIKSFGIEINFLSSLFIMCLIVFSSMIPSTSIFVGPYQFAYIIGLNVFGVTKEPALAVALINQVILMGLVTIFGLLFMFSKSRDFSAIKEELSPVSE